MWANAYAMRRISAGVLLLLLLATSAPFVEATSKGVISCTPADTDMLPANWPLDDGTCVRVDLGILSPGETLSFDIDSDVLNPMGFAEVYIRASNSLGFIG